MQLSRYLKAYPSKTKPDHFLLFSTLRTSSALIPGATMRRLLAGTDPGPDGDTLARLGMLVADPDAEREQVRSLLDRMNSRSRSFNTLVVLNLDCNLNCGYCYEETFRGEQYMSQETAQLLVQRLVREQMAAGRDVLVSFYGGEPLLSEDLIRSISEQLSEAAREHKVRFGFTLVTNGTLLNRETALRLVPLGLKAAKFTLDGPREIHDRQRPYTSGSGSFDAIVDNIAAVCDLLSVTLGGNYYQENYRDFPRLLDQLVERGITPEKLGQVLFTPITPKSGCAERGSGCACSSEPWLIESSIYLREEIMRRGFATGKPAVSACVVELKNNVVVGCEGSLYKCPAFMGWEELRIGTLSQGVQDYAQSHGIGAWKNEECLDCAYLPICFGGCRFMNLVQGKGLADLDCRREFLDATLETFILQNMTYSRAQGATPAKPKE